MIWVPPLWHCGGGLLLILFPSPPPLGIAKKEIMQMREAAVAESRAPVVAPLNAGPFAVSCNVRIPKGFPATCVRSLPLPARKRDFRGRSARRAGERASEGGRLWTARTRHAYRNYVGGAKRIFITRERVLSLSVDRVQVSTFQTRDSLQLHFFEAEGIEYD